MVAVFEYGLLFHDVASMFNSIAIGRSQNRINLMHNNKNKIIKETESEGDKNSISSLRKLSKNEIQ